MNQHTNLIFVRSVGYFGDDSTQEFAKREADRMADLCGPEIGYIMPHVGWSFQPGAQGVVCARDDAGKVQAIGWAMQTEMGLNLSYAVSREYEGRGFARLVACMAIVEADRQYGGISNPDKLVHAQWRSTNPASGDLARRLGLVDNPRLDFDCATSSERLEYLGASAPAVDVVHNARQYLTEAGNLVLHPIYSHARFATKGFEAVEVSTAGDRRFSALNARLKDGRTIEEAYQLDVKGYRAQGSDWKLGKGKPALRDGVDLWQEYKALWQTWALENPLLMADLSAKARGKCLTDRFATSPVSQARALAEILNSRYELVDCPELEDATFDERQTALQSI